MTVATKMFEGFAAKKPKGALESFSFEAPPLGDFDVEVAISHCGICHSDLHLVENDWGISTFPLVPGHEIVGTIVKKGRHVLGLEIGQRVGVGWQNSSCHHCTWCCQGEENLCLTQGATCLGHFGGFAKGIVVDFRFALPLPDSLKSENAAPLLCGGATVFSPLLERGIDGTARVAVYGVGGLGHLAIQFAAALGCEVTAISSSAAKEQEALQLGAHHFASPNQVSSLKDSFDLILFTSSHMTQIEALVEALRPKGILCLLGVPGGGEVRLPFFSLISGRKTLCGSNIASPSIIVQMLEFAARHKIEAKTELYPMSEVNTALDRLRANQIHYRAVLYN